ncbi:NUDIX domain-containing protein [Nocardioides speluncae]|uniref:NUDIX domain-containing protein n=1 Tax=Nocardioides speluncae TaxID=2670337 RepID=UPI000D69D30B|nr:NUDIX domain-containing protein [Nocardioides speluncae]
MTSRVDWYDDPDAPAVNSLVPAAAVYVEHERRVLLIQRSDNGKWSMPGGTMEYGESLAQCAVREALEETGVRVTCNGVVGVFTDPLHRIQYKDGEVRQEFAVVYRAAYVAGEPTSSPESPRVQWVPRDDVLSLELDRSQRLRLEWALSHVETAWIDAH